MKLWVSLFRCKARNLKLSKSLDDIFASRRTSAALAGPLLRLETMPAFVAPEVDPASSAMVAALRSVQNQPAAAALFRSPPSWAQA